MNDNKQELPALPQTFLPNIANRLFESRTILVHGEITSKLAQEITAQLLALSAESEDFVRVSVAKVSLIPAGLVHRE